MNGRRRPLRVPTVATTAAVIFLLLALLSAVLSYWLAEAISRRVTRLIGRLYLDGVGEDEAADLTTLIWRNFFWYRYKGGGRV